MIDFESLSLQISSATPLQSLNQLIDGLLLDRNLCLIKHVKYVSMQIHEIDIDSVKYCSRWDLF
jgi:hypothetical protein